MLVELSEGSNVLPVKFSKAAAYRNMNFETLSELSRPATITLKGLQEIAGEAKDRDVYLYVKTKNLPPHGSKPVWLQTQKMAKAKEYATNRPKLPRRDQKRRGALAERSLARAAGNDAAEDASALDKSVTNESLDRYADLAPVLSGHQALLEAYPTYEVHAYFDSGKLVTRGKAQLKRLVEMIPFGFFLTHDGALYGFNHAIEGMDGVKLEEVEPNFYKVAIKNEGSIQVNTKIVAEEKPLPVEGLCPDGKTKPPCAPACPDGQVCMPKGRGGCGSCNIGDATHDPRPWLLVALGLLAAGWRRRKSAQRIG